MVWAHTDTDRQNAIYKDFAAFMSVYPEVKVAVDRAIKAVVRTRPPDPFVYLAHQLREANNDMRLEKQEQEHAAQAIQRRARGMKDRKRVAGLKQEHKRKKQEKDEADAAVKIQAMGRKRRDKARVEQMKRNNQVWLRELFRKMSQHAREFLDPEADKPKAMADDEDSAALEQVVAGEDGAEEAVERASESPQLGDGADLPGGKKKASGDKDVPAEAVLAFVTRNLDALAKLSLPERFQVSIPKQYSGMFKRVQSVVEADLDAFYTWVSFAALFGLTAEMADQADLEASAVRIQALGRKRRDQNRVRTLERKRQELEAVEEEGDTLGYTVDSKAHEKKVESHTKPVAP
mmetsp:Transcript_24487/g.47624  ORF Transcript_24487/g.47624 Transcript_24487/m.47624 type:complete len:348 (+) Transcript_24487:40-1083(+)